MMAVYKPWAGVPPAEILKAMARGSATIPTISPEMQSFPRDAQVYFPLFPFEKISKNRGMKSPRETNLNEAMEGV
jgi:hypothetical protein